jgi:hypothetical protein
MIRRINLIAMKKIDCGGRWGKVLGKVYWEFIFPRFGKWGVSYIDEMDRVYVSLER